MGIVLNHIDKQFGVPPVQVLKNISIEIPEGQFVSLTGKSGAGKSTLLYILSTLDNPSSGRVEFDGQDVSEMSSKVLHHFRNTQMGFIFQFHYLIAELTVLENILVPTLKLHQEEERKPQAESLLRQFGLWEKANRYPRQLSGGESQRVAIARALVMKPKYIFADEPTGSLDSANADNVMKILKDSNLKDRTTVVMVTHDPDFAKMATRQIKLSDGQIMEDLFNPS
jgi:putative ABC transport system ATP-binding protein/lipoprotein-releasing system ATP-binding protein